MKLISQGMIEDPIAFLKEKKIGNPLRRTYPKCYVEFDELLVVCFWADEDLDREERKVFAFDREGKIVWQIESWRKNKSQMELNDYDPYISVGYNTKDETLIVSTFGELFALVNLQTGGVTYAGSRFSPRK